MVKIIRKQKQNSSNNKPDDLSLKRSLSENIKVFENIFGTDESIILRNFETQDSTACVLVFTDGMVDREVINENILEPIMNTSISQIDDKSQVPDFLTSKVLLSDSVKKTANIDEIIGSILYGDTALLIDGADEVLLVNTKGWQIRSVDEPKAERVVRGPREGFVESITTNISLIRRKIKSPDLKFIFKQIGNITKTRVSLCYIQGLTNEKILKELLERLDRIDIDGVLASGYIEEFISDSPFSPFRTVGYTERPDVAAGKLLEGRIVILVDGEPSVVTLPYIFMEYLQASEDYYDDYIFASINRLLRYLAFFLTTSVTPVYVALTTYHQEMIPTPLLLSIAGAREGVPFPTIVEALGMAIIFDIIREAGVRLPEHVGSAVSIVGVLVIGQAAVEARFVSAPMVIITALSGISAFLIYKMKGALIFIRIAFIILSGFLGLYGYIFGIIGLFIHLFSIRSFGIPYMLNTGSFDPQDIKDMGIRAPWWYMYYRPKLIGSKKPVRQSNTTGKEKS